MSSILSLFLLFILMQFHQITKLPQLCLHLWFSSLTFPGACVTAQLSLSFSLKVSESLDFKIYIIEAYKIGRDHTSWVLFLWHILQLHAGIFAACTVIIKWLLIPPLYLLHKSCLDFAGKNYITGKEDTLPLVFSINMVLFCITNEISISEKTRFIDQLLTIK